MKINKVVGVIPARGGSKGLPNKNILCLGGKPLIAWTIEAALSSKHIDKVIVTTDSPEIASISESYGADIPFVRPANLATDSSQTIDVLKHSILEMGSDYGTTVLLQPTSPFRSSKHIDEAMSLFWNYDRCATLVSVCRPTKSPYLSFVEDSGGSLEPLFSKRYLGRRQDVPVTYSLNGAIYIMRSEDIMKKDSIFDEGEILKYEMSQFDSIDIDCALDLEYANFLTTKRHPT